MQDHFFWPIFGVTFTLAVMVMAMIRNHLSASRKLQLRAIQKEERLKAIEAGVPHSNLHDLAVDAGMVELSHAGLEQALLGRTSIEEVYFKTSGDRRRGESATKSGGRRSADAAVD